MDLLRFWKEKDVATYEENRDCLQEHRAIEKGHQDVVEVLLKSGADVEARATWLQIPSSAKAAFEGHAGIVDVLIQHSAKA